MNFVANSREIVVSWKNVSEDEEVVYNLECEDMSSDARCCLSSMYPSTSKLLNTTAGANYRFTLECRLIRTNDLIARTISDVRAEFSSEEMATLYSLAKTEVGRKLFQFNVLYRCKPQGYFDMISKYHDGIMQKYIKDQSGQPANHINGIISGLFFYARTDSSGNLPSSSPFGNIRMKVDARYLMNLDKHNFYFADFYCNKEVHYVTVVICRKNSESDWYCLSRMPKLDPRNNNFFRISIESSSKSTFYVNSNCWIELFYTEDIPLSIGEFENVPVMKGTLSRYRRMLNNKACEKCNLYPSEYDNFFGIERDRQLCFYNGNRSTYNESNENDYIERRSMHSENRSYSRDGLSSSRVYDEFYDHDPHYDNFSDYDEYRNSYDMGGGDRNYLVRENDRCSNYAGNRDPSW